MIDVLVVDDHPIFREGVKRILSATSKFYVSAEAEGGQEALNLIYRNSYDIIILDIAMTGRNGLEILLDIKNSFPDQIVLMMSMYNDKRHALRAIQSGASGYLTKSDVATDLIKALEKVVSGGVYVNTELMEKIMLDLSKNPEKLPHESLSNRELQIMQMIAKGMRTKEIANELALSASTVSTHRTRILDKMKLENTADLIQYAIKNRVILD